MDKNHRSRSLHIPSSVAKTLFHQAGHNNVHSDDDDEIIDEIFEEVVIVEEDANNRENNHPHPHHHHHLNPDPSSAYISGVGDLSCSVRRVEYRQNTFYNMKQEEVIEYVIEHAGSGDGDNDDPHYPTRHRQEDDEEDLVVLVEEVEEVVGDDNTEVEYYEDSEIEEIELDDDLFEEIIGPGDTLTSLTTSTGAGAGARASAATAVSSSSPANGNTTRTISKDNNNIDTTHAATANATTTAGTATPTTTNRMDDDEPEEQDTTEHEDPPCREDVVEAITYIVRQEKVLEYGLMSQNQIEEMNALPLEELCEIMKHFEICDNNNATIQWELVLAMVNPEYANLDEDEEVGDNEEDASEHGEEECDREMGCCHHTHHKKSGAAHNTSTNKDDSEYEDEEGDVFSVQSDVNPYALSSQHDVGSIASSYSLEVDQSEGQMSTLSQIDVENSDDEIIVVEESASTTPPMDPRIRAQYTKSMVELEKTHSFDS